MAGHSKWANIKHRKGRQDAKRSKVWSKCSRAIIVAAKNGGDPDMNLALRYAIDEAKAANMPKDTIEKAVKKGSGSDSDADKFESVTYEGYGPNGVAILVETLTDNRNRTAGEVRQIFDKSGGNLGTSGSVAYMFEAKGMILVTKDAANEENIMEVALEAGADDITDEDEVWQVVTDPSNYQPVKQAIEDAEIAIESAALTMEPQNTVLCTGKFVQKILNVIEAFEDQDDVQKVHANFDIPDEEMAALDG
jgi:YebC/PmpR family DNA-binding regulatory protein